MGYEIDVTSVTAVLLADGWHRVKGRSFGIEPYGYVATLTANTAAGDKGEKKEARNGKSKPETIPAVVEKGLAPVMGARWTKPSGEVIACPVASVLALRHGRVSRA